MKKDAIFKWLKKFKAHFSYTDAAMIIVRTIRGEGLTFHSIQDVYILEFEPESCKVVLINTDNEVAFFGSVYYLY